MLERELKIALETMTPHDFLGHSFTWLTFMITSLLNRGTVSLLSLEVEHLTASNFAFDIIPVPWLLNGMESTLSWEWLSEIEFPLDADPDCTTELSLVLFFL